MIQAVNENCRWVHTIIRSVKNCSSLEKSDASMTDLQAIMQTGHA